MSTADKDYSGFLNEDGTLRFFEWAEALGTDEILGTQRLGVRLGPRGSAMAHSSATGDGAISNGLLGCDVIRVAAGEGFVPHTHPGDHLLIVIGGRGTITYGGRIYPTRAGQVYMVEGAIPHAVGAITDHVILAVGSPHKRIDSTERMTPVEYTDILAEVGDLHCLICDVHATVPRYPHNEGCTHCPCPACIPLPGDEPTLLHPGH